MRSDPMGELLRVKLETHSKHFRNDFLKHSLLQVGNAQIWGNTLRVSGAAKTWFMVKLHGSSL